MTSATAAAATGPEADDDSICGADSNPASAVCRISSSPASRSSPWGPAPSEVPSLSCSRESRKCWMVSNLGEVGALTLARDWAPA